MNINVIYGCIGRWLSNSFATSVDLNGPLNIYIGGGYMDEWYFNMEWAMDLSRFNFYLEVLLFSRLAKLNSNVCERKEKTHLNR